MLAHTLWVRVFHTKSASASSTSELAWGSAVVTGVTLSGDAKGHITSVTVNSGKLKTPVTGVTLASGTNNGTVKLTVNGSATDNIAVKGLGTAAYKAEGYFAGSGHTHSAYVPTGRTITTASGLTGGGNLSANRTIGLAATGTAGTYKQVVVDAYGRVTSGNTADEKYTITAEVYLAAANMVKVTNSASCFSSIIIDGTVQSSVATGYSLSAGSHFIRYVMKDYYSTYVVPFAFNGCTHITRFEISSGIISIGNHAFMGCSILTACTIGNGVTSIGQCAFEDCTNLTNLTIGNSVISINLGAFRTCSKLAYVSFPSNIKNIGTRAFYNDNKLTRVIIPDNVTTIGAYAFGGCTGLTSCTIGVSVTYIGASAFESCSGLTSIEIPNAVTHIGNKAFHGCKALTACTIGSEVKSIGASAFTNCSGLTSIVIPESVTSIGSTAFYNCKSLTEINMASITPPALADSDIFSNTNNCPIKVPSASLTAYRSAVGWSTYASRITT